MYNKRKYRVISMAEDTSSKKGSNSTSPSKDKKGKDKSDSDQENKSPSKSDSGSKLTADERVIYTLEHTNDAGDTSTKLVKATELNFNKARQSFNKVQLNNLLKIHSVQKPLDKVSSLQGQGHKIRHITV